MRGSVYTFVYSFVGALVAVLIGLGGIELVIAAAAIATLLGAAYRGPGPTRR